MRKPTKPREPTKPTPPEKIKIEEISIDFPEGIFKISTIGDILKEYCERHGWYKPVVKDWSEIEIKHEWRYESMEFIALVPCKNLRYNQQLASYNKRVKTYIFVLGALGTILMNLLRIFLILFYYYYFGAQSNIFHSFIGEVLFFSWILILIIITYYYIESR